MTLMQWIKEAPKWLIVLYLSVLSCCLFVLDLAILLFSPRLLVSYLWIWVLAIRWSPFRYNAFENMLTSRQNRVSQDQLIYGETPICTGARLLKKFGLKKGKKLLDLGAGRGRVLIAGRLLGAESCGVDIVEQHVQAVAQSMKWIGAKIENRHAEQTALKDVTHVFVAWTTWAYKSRQRISEHLLSLDEGAIVIAITWPIDVEGLVQCGKGMAIFTWGFSPYWVYRRHQSIIG